VKGEEEEQSMEITDVKVSPVNEERLKAYVTIILDNCFLVRDVKVIQGNSGFFVAMPSKKRKDGTYRDVAHPINSETRKMMESVILDSYWKLVGEEDKEHKIAPAPEEEKPEESSEDTAA
jgi:stage V sporulation protein G